MTKLTKRQRETLTHLQQCRHSSLGLMAKAFESPLQAISRIVNNLERYGLVTVQRYGRDMRELPRGRHRVFLVEEEGEDTDDGWRKW